MVNAYREVIGTVKEITAFLVQSDFQAVEDRSNGVGSTADELRNAIEAYGRELIMPPLEEFEQMDVIEVEGACPKRWSVRLGLWTREGGRSDLSLELTLIEREQGLFTVEVDDFHVL